MANLQSKDFVHWINGVDLSKGALTTFQDATEAQTEDVTGIGHEVVHQSVVGTVDYTLSEAGFLRDEAVSLRRTIEGAGGGPGIVGKQGRNSGAPVTMVTRLNLDGFSVQPAVNEISKLDGIEYSVHPDGELLRDARLLFYGVDDATNTLGTGNSPLARADFKAAHSGGWTMIVMTDGLVLDGRSEFVPTLYTSATQGSGYTAVSGGNVAWNSNGVHVAVIEGTAALSRYVSLGTSWGGSGGSARSANIVAALAQV